MKKKVAMFLVAMSLGVSSSFAYGLYDTDCVYQCWQAKRLCDRTNGEDCQITWEDCSARCGY